MCRITAAPLAGLAMLAVGCFNDFDALALGADGSGGAAEPTGSASAQRGSSADGSGGRDASSSSVGAGGAGGRELRPRDCKDIKETDPGAGDGDYPIDPDGDGTLPITVRCDMTIDGGGWTRFNWLHVPFVTGADPLAVTLDACNVGDDACPGRIPPEAAPTHLLVKDLTAGEHAAWAFDGSPVSNAILGALRDKTPACAEGPGFNPYLDTSTEAFCSSDGAGCDSFKYTDSGCNGATAWILELDDDSHFCAAAFKLGAATGIGNCGPVDWGFLDDCDCLDESGELYFR